MIRRSFQLASTLICITLCYIDKTRCQQNIALGANVTQESTYTHQNPFMPDGDGYKAVDGNTSSDWYVGGCACTKKRPHPWMTLDFGSVYTIERMVIYNRYDEQKSSKGCCPERLHDFTISVKQALEDDWIPVYQQVEAADKVTDIMFDTLYDARYMEVKITSAKAEYLTICELEVYEQGDPVDGGWTAWGDWTACNPTCGSATASRSRSCSNPAPKNGGADCAGESTETTSCPSVECPVNGGWTDFGEWGECSATCGSGFRVRTRSCTNPSPSGGGVDCVGSATEAEVCVGQPCPAPQTDPSSSCTTTYPPENCEDVRVNLLMGGQPAISDQYVIVTPSGQQIMVFCDFYHSREVSYTYLSPAAIDVIDTITLKRLHNRRIDYVNARLLLADGGQKDYEVETLASFRNKYAIVAQINEAVGYWQPVNYGTSSFLYLGSQPAEAAPANTIDKSTNPMFGYQSNGNNYKFINCNQLAKGYVALFTNATAFQASSNYEWYNPIYPDGSWDLEPQLISGERYLPDNFFMVYEIRMGGCGGYATSFTGLNMGIEGAQVGLPLDYRPNCLTEPIIQSTTPATTGPITGPTTGPATGTTTEPTPGVTTEQSTESSSTQAAESSTGGAYSTQPTPA